MWPHPCVRRHEHATDLGAREDVQLGRVERRVAALGRSGSGRGGGAERVRDRAAGAAARVGRGGRAVERREHRVHQALEQPVRVGLNGVQRIAAAVAAVAAGGRAVGLVAVVAERARLGRVGGGAQRNERLGRARAQLGLLDAVGVREVGARVSGAAASSFAALSCSAPEGRHNVLYW